MDPGNPAVAGSDGVLEGSCQGGACPRLAVAGGSMDGAGNLRRLAPDRLDLGLAPVHRDMACNYSNRGAAQRQEQASEQVRSALANLVHSSIICLFREIEARWKPRIYVLYQSFPVALQMACVGALATDLFIP